MSSHEEMFFLILFLGVLLQVHTDNLKNLALGKPVKSSNVNFGGLPERAVDGNPNPVYRAGSCTMADDTRTHPLPWWQVNLQGDYYIYTVALTNRGDDFTFRLHDFTVEVYSEDPAVNPGASVQVCASYPGTVGAAVREVLVCSPGVRGQYVRVQKNSLVADDALHICEAEVFGKPSSETKAPKAVFSRLPRQRLPGTPLSEESGTAAECGRICFNMTVCDGFNFDGGFGGGTGICHFMLDQQTPVTDGGYDLFKCDWP